MIKYTSVDDVYLHDDLVSDPAIKQGLIERAVSGSEGYQVMPDDNGVMGAYAVGVGGKHIPLGKVDDILLADAGNGVVTDAPTGVRVGRAGITPAQSAKAGGLDRPLVALLDTLAGALHGATAQTIGLPGDIRSILDLISKDGAQKYLGDAVMPTTERMQEILPSVIPDGVANQKDREQTAKVFSDVGTFLPAPGLPEAIKPAAKLIKGAVKMTEGLPVGLSTKAVGEGVDDLGFYSAAAKAVDEIQQPKGTGEQFLAQITKTPGVKQDEIMWTGLDDFLKSKKTVTKQEVQDYLANNRVEIKEVQLADGGLKKKFSIDSPEDQDFYDVIDKQGKVIFTGPEDEADYLLDRSLTKYSKYTLPGGENYREVLLTLPVKDNVTKVSSQAPSGWGNTDGGTDGLVERGNNRADFRSGHFDQPNILAHLRVNDRVDAEGKKVLMVEEVQSDWHQAGRKKGYQGDIEPSKIAYEKAAQASHDYFKEMYVAHGVFGKDAEKLKELDKLSDGAKNLVMETLLKEMSSEETAQYEKLFNQTKNTLTTYMGAKRSAVPDAPFKTTWQELAMKRAIQMAAEGGYDRIAFTTGKTQAARFDLSKQIDEIRWSKAKDGTYGVNAMRDGDSVISQNKLSIEQVEELIGKDIAKKIEEGSTDRFFGALKDIDLQFGGEGMAGFYDNILPKFLDKYAKKWEAKTGMTELGNANSKVIKRGNEYQVWSNDKLLGSGKSEFEAKESAGMATVHYIDITPKMRESVVTKGQPMFAIGAGGAGAATQQNQEKK